MIDKTYIVVIVNIPEVIIKTICNDPKNNQVIRFFGFPRCIDYACYCILTLQRSTLENITNPRMPATTCILDSNSNISLLLL